MDGPFRGCLSDALEATPTDHPVYPMLKDWIESRRDDPPLWDAVLFFPPEVEWKEQPPHPTLWAKQVGYDRNADGRWIGTFFRNRCRSAPIESSWRDEVDLGIRGLLREQEGAVPGS